MIDKEILERTYNMTVDKKLKWEINNSYCSPTKIFEAFFRDTYCDGGHRTLIIQSCTMEMATQIAHEYCAKEGIDSGIRVWEIEQGENMIISDIEC